MFTIGCHLSSAKGYLKMAQDAASIDGNTFQFFTRNPRGGKAKAIDPADVAAFHEFAVAHGITTFLAHAPYTMNPAAAKPETRAFAIELLTDDLMRMENTPGQLYNMHPGCHVGQGAETGIALIADALNQVIAPEQSTTLLLETMAARARRSAAVLKSWPPSSTPWNWTRKWACAWTPATCGTAATTSPAIWTACWRSSIA